MSKRIGGGIEGGELGGCQSNLCMSDDGPDYNVKAKGKKINRR